MDIQTQQTGRAIVVAVSGKIDVITAPALELNHLLPP